MDLKFSQYSKDMFFAAAFGIPVCGVGWVKLQTFLTSAFVDAEDPAEVDTHMLHGTGIFTNIGHTFKPKCR